MIQNVFMYGNYLSDYNKQLNRTSHHRISSLKHLNAIVLGS